MCENNLVLTSQIFRRQRKYNVYGLIRFICWFVSLVLVCVNQLINVRVNFTHQSFLSRHTFYTRSGVVFLIWFVCFFGFWMVFWVFGSGIFLFGWLFGFFWMVISFFFGVDIWFYFWVVIWFLFGWLFSHFLGGYLVTFWVVISLFFWRLLGFFLGGYLVSFWGVKWFLFGRLFVSFWALTWFLYERQFGFFLVFLVGYLVSVWVVIWVLFWRLFGFYLRGYLILFVLWFGYVRRKGGYGCIVFSHRICSYTFNEYCHQVSILFFSLVILPELEYYECSLC